jgi:hypothetical protein
MTSQSARAAKTRVVTPASGPYMQRCHDLSRPAEATGAAPDRDESDGTSSDVTSHRHEPR